MQRRRILVFSFFPAFNPPSSGGELRLLEIWSAVAQTHDVTLLTSTHMHEPVSLLDHAPGFREIRVPKEEHAGAIWDELQGMFPGAEVSAPGVALGGGRFSALHQAYLDHYPASEMIVHTSPFTIDYDLFLGLDGKPRVYESYNAEYRLAPAVYSGPGSEAMVDYIATLERRLIIACSLVTVCSGNDRAAFEELVPEMTARVIEVPNGVTPFAGARDTRPGPPKSVIFIGSAHRPNRIAAEFIVTELAPHLPQLTFDIVGGCLDGNVPLPANVIRHGIVSAEQKTELLQQADIALNPVVDGSGSNLKVAEYLGVGLPLISTAFGVRGFDMKPHQHYISCSLDRFAEALARAAADWGKFLAIGEVGRTHIQTSFSWKTIGESFASELTELVGAGAGPFEAGIALVLNDYPVSTSTGGGATRIKGMYSAIAEKLPVIFLTFWDGVGIRTTYLEGNILEISVPKSDSHRDEQTRSDAKHHASSADVISLIHAPRSPVFVALYEHLRRFAWRICVEHIYMVGLPKKFGDKFVHSSHNHELALKRETLRGHPDEAALLRIVADAEAYAVEAASLLIGVSAEDLTNLSRGRTTFPPSMVIPNGVLPPATENAIDNPIRMGNQPAVFLGSGHLPNVEAARFVAEHVATRCSGVTFHFIGSVCDSLRDLKRQNIVLWGVIDEIEKSRVLNACQLALNPVTTGGGSNVKFADYLAHGLPILTTEFGLRGIDGAEDYALVVERSEFAHAVLEFFAGRTPVASSRAERIGYFTRCLSLVQSSRRFLTALESLDIQRKRVLLATYRYGAPAQGGAEAHMLKFLEAMSADGRFDIDVISPDIERIESASRFRSIFPLSQAVASPVGLPRVTSSRFAVDDRMAIGENAAAAKIWASEPDFERAWMEPLLSKIAAPKLLWGWCPPERHGDQLVVRALHKAALFIPKGAQARLTLRPDPTQVIQIKMYCEGAFVPIDLRDERSLELPPAGGLVTFESAPPPLTLADPRLSGFLLTRFEVDGVSIDLRAAKLDANDFLDGNALAEALSDAASSTRFARSLSLTEARGPHAHSYSDWLATNVTGYDLVIAHNAVFKPTVDAIHLAKAGRVPSILVAQVHLDDDFYHFPDIENAVGSATVSFVAPSQTLGFYQRRGHKNVRLLGAGADLNESYSELDRAAFRSACPGETPHVLVLGRKSHSKNYLAVLEAVENVSKVRPLQTVMIGIDEDGDPITLGSTVYLGEQDRAIVRGALMSCVALVTMSRSESFGMVILEAWAAGVPVIANIANSAFRDLVVDRRNGLLVSADDLESSIVELLDSPTLSSQLVHGGRSSLASHGWHAVSARFIDAASMLAGSARA